MRSDNTIIPEDDGLHIVDFNIGDFEWWYFDIADQVSGCFVKIVFHIGTDPLRTRIFPQLAISMNTPTISESFIRKFRINELKSDTKKCDIAIGDEIKFQILHDIPTEYLIQINLPEFRCNLSFKGEIPGWKPLGSEIHQQKGKRKSAFSWVIPCPRAIVDGDFNYKGTRIELHNSVGYHDHNFIRVDKTHPLFMDEIINKWYWGKAYTGTFTIIFMDIFGKSSRTSSLMIAEKDAIIHSSNNLVETSVLDKKFDNILRANFASSIKIKSLDRTFNFDMTYQFEKMLDRRDLLSGVNPLLMWLIKKLIAKPVYHGIHARVIVNYGGLTQEGYGNYECMIFRGCH
jgi:hypothetical protein